MAKKLIPRRRNGRFYFDEDHVPESFFFGTLPSSVRSFLRRPFNTPTDPAMWIEKSAINQHHINPTIIWLGHSSFLIQISGVNIITDPIFDKPSFIYSRMIPLGISLLELPPIHVILISHNHRDHMDEDSLVHIKKHTNNTVRVLVPMGDKRWFDDRGFAHTHEFEWEQVHSFNTTNGVNIAQEDSVRQSPPVNFTFVPAHHWSQRTLFDKNRSLWGGWVIHAGSCTIYFAGDTAYRKECFDRIRYLFPALDMALMPVGPAEPRSWMKHSHVDAHEAGQAFLDVGARCMIPMHWGTFSFGNDRFDAPINEIRGWWDANIQTLTDKQLLVMKVGQKITIPGY